MCSVLYDPLHTCCDNCLIHTVVKESVTTSVCQLSTWHTYWNVSRPPTSVTKLRNHPLDGLLDGHKWSPHKCGATSSPSVPSPDASHAWIQMTLLHMQRSFSICQLVSWLVCWEITAHSTRGATSPSVILFRGLHVETQLPAPWAWFNFSSYHFASWLACWCSTRKRGSAPSFSSTHSSPTGIHWLPYTCNATSPLSELTIWLPNSSFGGAQPTSPHVWRNYVLLPEKVWE